MTFLDGITNGINSSLKYYGIKTRPESSLGYWVSFLLPFSVVLSLFKNPEIVSLQYKYAGLVSAGFIISNVAIIYNCSKSNKFPSNLTCTAIALYTSSLFCTCLHKSYVFSFITGFITVFSYVKGFTFVLRTCPKCFSFGEASMVTQAAVLFLYTATVSIGGSFVTTPTKVCQISNVILQIGMTGVAVISFLVYKFETFRRTAPFYTLSASVSVAWIFLPLHVILNRSPVLWILNLLTEKFATVQMVVFWGLCSAVAVLYLRRQILQGRKAGTVVRKMFHVLAVLVVLPGLIDQCAVLYLATGIVFAVFVALEMLRLLNLPPLGEILQDGFTVFSDEKDAGGLALTPIYLLVGCSMPFWIHPEPCDVTDSAGFHLLPLISGILSVGVGDTMASACGKIIGKHHWPNSDKTIEGTIACVLSQIALIFILVHFGFIGNTQENIVRGITASVVSSLVEAKTDQVDNLILPLINYIILV